jgi:hypothetical protein
MDRVFALKDGHLEERDPPGRSDARQRVSIGTPLTDPSD